jgi:hypothetical protein
MLLMVFFAPREIRTNTDNLIPEISASSGHAITGLFAEGLSIGADHFACTPLRTDRRYIKRPVYRHQTAQFGERKHVNAAQHISSAFPHTLTPISVCGRHGGKRLKKKNAS